ncbi:hypothetical protein DPMN_162445 [Dreissena polymorpha]|uniref:Uncharacterized protein n=1 Tax=Dreissena polymorpha TaxID=45954 RepID=A0A9D4IS04_DREPO|nr:hypothetical protein DPMN_190966 [Dreissena polymorpha]KAH3784490.1 hypothetical protein DPMN_162445 [Dreissena polymorpha]
MFPEQTESPGSVTTTLDTVSTVSLVITTSRSNSAPTATTGTARYSSGTPGLVMGPCIVEIDRIIIRYVQYQFEVNRCRNEKFNFPGSSAKNDGQTHKCNYSSRQPEFVKFIRECALSYR